IADRAGAGGEGEENGRLARLPGEAQRQDGEGRLGALPRDGDGGRVALLAVAGVGDENPVRLRLRQRRRGEGGGIGADVRRGVALLPLEPLEVNRQRAGDLHLQRERAAGVHLPPLRLLRDDERLAGDGGDGGGVAVLRAGAVVGHFHPVALGGGDGRSGEGGAVGADRRS